MFKSSYVPVVQGNNLGRLLTVPDEDDLFVEASLKYVWSKKIWRLEVTANSESYVSPQLTDLQHKNNVTIWSVMETGVPDPEGFIHDLQFNQASFRMRTFVYPLLSRTLFRCFLWKSARSFLGYSRYAPLQCLLKTQLSWLVVSNVKSVNTSLATNRLLGSWCNLK